MDDECYQYNLLLYFSIFSHRPNILNYLPIAWIANQASALLHGVCRLSLKCHLWRIGFHLRQKLPHRAQTPYLCHQRLIVTLLLTRWEILYLQKLLLQHLLVVTDFCGVLMPLDHQLLKCSTARLVRRFILYHIAIVGKIPDCTNLL